VRSSDGPRRCAPRDGATSERDHVYADLRNAYDALMARFKGVFSVAAPSIWNLLAVLDQAVADDFDALNVLLLC
jgi:hypothetical protein